MKPSHKPWDKPSPPGCTLTRHTTVLARPIGEDTHVVEIGSGPGRPYVVGPLDGLVHMATEVLRYVASRPVETPGVVHGVRFRDHPYAAWEEEPVLCMSAHDAETCLSLEEYGQGQHVAVVVVPVGEVVSLPVEHTRIPETETVDG